DHFLYCHSDILFRSTLVADLLAKYDGRRMDSLVALGTDVSIAKTHPIVRAFRASLSRKEEDVVQMGVNALGVAVLDILNKNLSLWSNPEGEEVPLSGLLAKSEAREAYYVYEGPWWHLGYPSDFAALRQKIGALHLPG